MNFINKTKSRLKKHTSEEVFRISPQPPETCPMIDDLINNLEKYVESLNSYFLFIQELVIFDTYEECPCCESYDNVAEFNFQIENSLVRIDRRIDEVNFFIHKINLLRKDCENIRETAKENKRIIWKNLEKINKSKNIDGISLIKTEPKKNQLSFLEVNKNFIHLDSINEVLCENDCVLSNILIENLKKVKSKKVNTIKNESLIFQKIKDNRNKLLIWNQEIEKLSLQLLLKVIA